MRRSVKGTARSCRLLWRSVTGHEPSARVLASNPSAGGVQDGCEGFSWSAKLFPWVLGFSAAAVWSETHCEAIVDHSILTDARRKVMRAWVEVNHDLDRLEATLPFHFSLPRTRSPDIWLKGNQISIQFKIAPGADFSGLLVDLVAQLVGQSPGQVVQDGTLSIEVAECSAAQVISLRRPGETGMRVQVHVPRTSGHTAEIEFLLDAKVPIGEDDLRVIASAMRSANGSRQEAAGHTRLYTRRFGGEGDGFDAVIRHLGSTFGDELRGLDEHFGSFFREFERLAFPPLPQEAVGEAEELSARRREIAEQPGTSTTATDYGSPEATAAVKHLEQLGAVVYPPSSKDAVDWGILAGYEDQKEQISETLLLALLHPEVYDEVSSKTRKQKGSNRPRAVLFEGPPGCGKTTSARVLATQAASPLVYVPVEAIASKWYGEKPRFPAKAGRQDGEVCPVGESEKNLGKIFKAAEELDSCLIFLDEIDSLATQRSSEMHEATRRILGVLLRQLDGFEGRRSIVIAATNRKEDLDPALMSRFDTSVRFQLPDQACRQLILKQYAQQLSTGDLQRLAEGCQGFSGRDLRDVCEQAERKTASKIIRGQQPQGSLPAINDYLDAASDRQTSKTSAVTPTASLANLYPRRML